jgi:hypothetical protein
LDRQAISNPEQVLNDTVDIEKKFESQSDTLKAAFKTFNDSLEDLLVTFPSVVPEKSLGRMQRYNHVTNIIEMFTILFRRNSFDL